MTKRGANQYTAYTFIDDTTKACSSCTEIKPHSEFYKDSQNIRNRGLSYYCKACARLKARANHKARRDRNDPKYFYSKRSNHIKHKYGITLEEYEQKLKKQSNKCSICSKELVAGTQQCHYDHNHATGQFRAFLCTNCNRGIGHFQEDQQLLLNAVDYLESHK